MSRTPAASISGGVLSGRQQDAEKGTEGFPHVA